jgi:hypothetical protein
MQPSKSSIRRFASAVVFSASNSQPHHRYLPNTSRTGRLTTCCPAVEQRSPGYEPHVQAYLLFIPFRATLLMPPLPPPPLFLSLARACARSGRYLQLGRTSARASEAKCWLFRAMQLLDRCANTFLTLEMQKSSAQNRK